MTSRKERKRVPGIEGLREAGAFEGADFTEAEWAAAIQAAVAGGKRDKRPARERGEGRRVHVWGLRPAFGVALGLLVVGAAVWLGVRRFPWLVPATENIRVEAAETPAGDVPLFTWISEETGLQVVWFVNDDLNLEE